MDKKILDYILILLIFVLIIIVVIMLIYFDKNSFECLSNPVNYYEQMKNLSCVCTDVKDWSINLSNIKT